MLAPPWLLALALVVGLLVLLPARRLQLAGFAPKTIGLFALLMWALAMFVAVSPGGARILVPVLLVAYLAPFVAAPERMARVLRRGGRTESGGGTTGDRPPMKNVTPPEVVDADSQDRSGGVP
ncbi:MAG TPA: hypothetical protein VM408_06095 [Methylomirabilota bacterium]|nr:hypothetical protein [Methylomirabilota bacterium]